MYKKFFKFHNISKIYVFPVFVSRTKEKLHKESKIEKVGLKKN
jgi:hypothetical protein